MPIWHSGGSSVDLLTLGEALVVAGIVAFGLIVAIVYDVVRRRRQKP